VCVRERVCACVCVRERVLVCMCVCVVACVSVCVKSREEDVPLHHEGINHMYSTYTRSHIHTYIHTLHYTLQYIHYTSLHTHTHTHRSVMFGVPPRKESRRDMSFISPELIRLRKGGKKLKVEDIHNPSKIRHRIAVDR
jgi:hypothetical protein